VTTILPPGFDTTGMIPVPQPDSFSMMLVGLLGLAISGRKRSSH